MLLWPRGAWLLWPATSLTWVAATYWRSDPGGFGKVDGLLPLGTKIALGPVLLGQHLSLWYYARRSRAWDIVTPEVWIGRRLNAREARRAIRRGVRSVLDLTVAFSETRPFRQIDYLHLPVLDLTAPSVEQLGEAAAFIAQRARFGIVYVHCKIGYSRSAAVIGAYLMTTGRVATGDQAVRLLRSARPGIVVRPEILASLREFERRAGEVPRPTR